MQRIGVKVTYLPVAATSTSVETTVGWSSEGLLNIFGEHCSAGPVSKTLLWRIDVHIEEDRLCLCVVFQCCLATLASNTAFLPN